MLFVYISQVGSKYILTLCFIDEDITSYHFYIGSSENQLSLKREGILQTQTTEILDEKSEYFWQVITIDENRNQSRSKVFSFQTD
mgnify:CR=1 FL=1